MTIEQELVNVFDLSIRRPARVGPAGDTDPAADVVLASGLRAIAQRWHRVLKGRNGVDLVVEGIYFIDPTLPDGSPLPDLRDRDYLQHTDVASGRLTAPRTILAVSYESLGAEVDHIELEV